MSPVMAAAAAIVGKLADLRKIAENATPAKASPKLDVTPQVEDVDSDEDLDRIMDIPVNSTDVRAHAGAGTASAGLPKFTTLRGMAAPMKKANMDTDAIIPKQFLKTIKRTGLGSALFHPL
jgi:3-isopropylmalate dehydratase